MPVAEQFPTWGMTSLRQLESNQDDVVCHQFDGAQGEMSSRSSMSCA